MKYERLHLPGQSPGPPQTTKISSGVPPDPLQDTLKKPAVFSSAARALPKEPPRASREPPATPRDPNDAQYPPGNSDDLPGAPEEPHRARGPPGTAPSIWPGGMRGAIEPDPAMGTASATEKSAGRQYLSKMCASVVLYVFLPFSLSSHRFLIFAYYLTIFTFCDVLMYSVSVMQPPSHPPTHISGNAMNKPQKH